MFKMFKLSVPGRTIKCPECGVVMAKGSKQLKGLVGVTRFGAAYKYICPSCADLIVSNIAINLHKLKKEL